jgi:hypothetical protein
MAEPIAGLINRMRFLAAFAAVARLVIVKIHAILALRMRLAISPFIVLLCVLSVRGADAGKQPLFTVPPMPPLGANKWSVAPIVVPLTLAAEGEAPKTIPVAEAITLNGELPVLDHKGKPIAVRREKDAAGNETILGIDSSGQGNFFVKVPASDKQGRVITFDVPRGLDAQTQRPHSDRYTLRIFAADGNWFYQRSGCLKGTVLGQPVYIIDGNTNGRFDDTGTDLIVVGKADPTLLSNSLVLNNTTYTVKLDLGGGGPLTLTPVTYPETLGRGIAHLNAWRERLGLPAIKLHDEMCRWAQCHANFLVANNVMGLGEDPALRGYTKEGAWAGAHSCVVAGPSDIMIGIDELTDSAFHRILLLSPYLTVTGMAFTPADPQFNGSVGETIVDVGTTGDNGIEWLQPIACPTDGQTGVKALWSGTEDPSPLKGDQPPPGGLGIPITLTFPSAKAAKTLSLRAEGAADNDMPKDVQAEFHEDGVAAALDCYMSDPQHPAQAAVFADNLSSVVLVPKEPLKAETVYSVTVQCTWRGKPYKKQWRFSTGNVPLVPPVKDAQAVYRRTAQPPLPAR